MASTIGIKIANGEFYSIIEENSSVKKRLVLTTVHDKQRSVQIDLYKSFTRTMADALYIGSVVVENIKARPRGEPSIELVIASTEGGEITADAVDLDTGSGTGHQILNVSLKSLTEEHAEEDFPDFELEQQKGPPVSLYGGKNLRSKRETDPEQKKSFPILIVILAGLLIVLACLLIWFFLIRTKSSGSDTTPPAGLIVPAEQPVPLPPARETVEPAPQKEVPKEPPPAPALVQAPKEPPKAAANRDRSRPVPPVASYKVPAAIPKEGISYKVRWGDTLWDIAAAFYRNPWLYPRIARFNNIRNPDLIISGTSIRIPPVN